MVRHDVAAKPRGKVLNRGDRQVLCRMFQVFATHIPVRELPVSQIARPDSTCPAHVVGSANPGLGVLCVDVDGPGHAPHNFVFTKHDSSGQGPIRDVVPVFWAFVGYQIARNSPAF